MRRGDLDRTLRRLACLAMAAAAVACGQSPNAPRSFVVPIPQAAAAAPPVIRSITVPTSRREVATDVAITAVVEDADTPLSDLNFIWSANVGTVTSTGTTATWRHAPGLLKGLDVIITLTVVNQFLTKENDQLVVREFRVVGQAAPFRVHDSVAELKELGRKFLIDLFGRSEISPAACLVDFSDNGPCRAGKEAELSDLIAHRRDYVVLDRRMNGQQVTLTGTNTARIDNDAWFMDRKVATGFVGTTSGNFPLTAVYESQRWWLCSSSFDDDLRGDGGIATIKRNRGKSFIKK